MRKYFYNLSFSYKTQDETEKICSHFNIGYFSSKLKAQEVIGQLKGKPGFCEYPLDCFILRKQAVYFSRNVFSKEAVTLYNLTHEYMLEDYCLTNVWTDFGLFESREAAICELNKQSQKRPYKNYPNGFYIDEWHVNRDIQWQEGFTHANA